MTRILSVFGITGLADARAPGSSQSFTTREYLDAFVAFRDELRALARTKSLAHDSTAREVLSACDRVRDSTLAGLGVRLEDRAAGQSGERGDMTRLWHSY